ncbi:PREDICTED: AP-2 complex subunit alpha-2-like [Amphimedon queenslandica]|uniref:Clathrin adaptor alpha/beta/gamma-adaptin appendage Ig-like subdomain domain-containing protein n=1 Tax=Amphimedon queenslandica TaxID=400682 RepID=A0A1X7T319_AMPQE|nr:PREDICTED: AP-2 complex subunit alpha-2-like [Amphimedon queenslandica]|eukprot:XP_019861669.1 PREDICTED: AP-2 complex subunit alpha-2-like [Amphimedon queenslandica]
MRFLSIEGLCNLSLTEFSREAVRKHQDTVLNTLKTERDVSVRQKAIDLLYAMCDHSNAQTIVQELLQYLEKADYSIREALVLKIAILSEKYASDYSWYVDTILNLIRLAGDYISEEVWYRIIQIVVNKQEVQGYAAKTCFEALQAPACHENMIKVGGYILGEFGNLIAGDTRSSPLIQFQLLHSKFPFCSLTTRSLLLSTYVKFINLYPEIKTHIQGVFEQDGQSRNSDLELQQRAIEYLKLSHKADVDILATIFEVMPVFPEKDSLLLSKLYQTAPWMAKLHESPETQKRETDPEPIAAARPTPPSAGGDASDPIYAQVNKPKQASIFGSPAAATPPTTTPTANEFSLIDVSPAPAPAPVTAPSVTAPVVPTEPAPLSLSPEAEQSFKRFVIKNSGVLYENHALQIGVKSEFNGNLGRIGIFFGNKSNSSLVNFSTEITTPSESASGLTIESKPVPQTIDAGAQVQQIINAECLGVFLEAPLMKVSFTTGGSPQQFLVKIPIMLHKFSEKVTMDSPTFFSRWKQLANPAQESQKIFTTTQPMDKETASTKLTGFGFSVLEGIDPNSDNFVSACIVKTKKVLVGCLLRLEPNHQTKQYRLTLRTSHESVSKNFNELISELF